MSVGSLTGPTARRSSVQPWPKAHGVNVSDSHLPKQAFERAAQQWLRHVIEHIEYLYAEATEVAK
jgi:hypothetical protein